MKNINREISSFCRLLVKAPHNLASTYFSSLIRWNFQREQLISPQYSVVHSHNHDVSNIYYVPSIVMGTEYSASNRNNTSPALVDVTV